MFAIKCKTIKFAVVTWMKVLVMRWTALCDPFQYV